MSVGKFEAKLMEKGGRGTVVEDEERSYFPVLRNDKKTQKRLSRKRLVSKEGDIMVEVRNAKSERWRFWVDLFTSLIQLKWRWVLLLFCASYIFTWLIFGCLWALLVLAYGPGYCVEKVYTT